MDPAHLRNIGIIAHIDAGKTTFSERILFYSDVIHRMGEVHEGAATMDFLPEEQERGITIASACITCAWKGCTINLVDTPGHVDFTIEVERCLRVLDGAVGLFCAVSGVEPQSETVWRQADSFGVPRLAVVNKLDRPGASYAAVLQAMRDRLGARPVPVTIPLGEGEDFAGVLDLVRQTKIIFDTAGMGKDMHVTPFTAEEAALAAPHREALLDALTENDDALLEECLAGTPAPDRIDAALCLAVRERRLVPVFAASALRNMGVQPVLDAVVRYLPGPLDVPAAHGVAVPNPFRRAGKGEDVCAAGKEVDVPAIAPAKAGEEASASPTPESGPPVLVPADPSAPLCALIFKIVMEGARKLCFVRLYAGTLKEGDAPINVTQGSSERITRIFRLHAGRREQLDSAVAGDIVAVLGLKTAHTGDSLCAKERPLLLESIRRRLPVISLAFEPHNTEEGERLDEALSRFADEDPTLSILLENDTGRRLVSGMGELHLEVVGERLRREYSLAPRVGNPQVVCRETIKATAEAEATFDRELGGVPQFGRVRLVVAPAEREAGVSVTFRDAPDAPGAPGALPAALLEVVRRGVLDAVCSGPKGYPVEDVAVEILAVERKEGVNAPPALHMAAQSAFRQALEDAGPVLLEPLMQLDIGVPDAFLGAVVSLLGARQARVEAVEDKAGQKSVMALAPMRSLFGFATSLRSATQGRAGVAMQFRRFDVNG